MIQFMIEMNYYKTIDVSKQNMLSELLLKNFLKIIKTTRINFIKSIKIIPINS